MNMDEAIQHLHELTNDGERGRRATEYLSKVQDWSLELGRIRRESVENMLQRGDSHAVIADAIGLSRGRIGQIAKTGPAPERAFLGSGRLTIVVGQKPKPNQTKHLVAGETVAARDRLKTLASAYQLEADNEDVPPPGLVDLNRDNLIVLAGPRLFPLVGQILASDPNLRFEVDEVSQWTLRNIEAEKTFTASPRDDKGNPVDVDNPNRDFGYLGRLPRPDGNGTFLYAAGIHAVGTLGVVAYLEQNLAQIYSEVKTRRFSMLVECEYDPETRAILTAKQASPIYKRS